VGPSENATREQDQRTKIDGGNRPFEKPAQPGGRLSRMGNDLKKGGVKAETAGQGTGGSENLAEEEGRKKHKSVA